MAPDISVVTISYNQGPFLEAALSSVLSQTGLKVQYIVIDACSSDSTPVVLERYRNRIDNLIVEADRGPADGLNKGLALAEGKYFYFLNADDILTARACVQACRFLDENPHIDVVYGNGEIIDAQGSVIRFLPSARHFSPALYLTGVASIVQQATFIRTDALRSAGGFNILNRTSWDGEAFFNLACRGSRFKRHWSTWGQFRVHGASISGSGNQNDRYKQDRRRLIVEAGYAEGFETSAYAKLLWAADRVSDIRRWRSYFQGRVDLAKLAEPSIAT